MSTLQTSSMDQQPKTRQPGQPLSPGPVLLAGLLLMVGAALASLCFGAASFTPGQLLAALMGRGEDAALRILLYVRLPRTLATLLAGSALAVAGVVIQGVLGNPLASPGVIGVNAGAGFAVALVCALVPSGARLMAPAAFAGALGAVLLVYGIGHATGASRSTVILAGVAVSGILSAGIDAVVTLVPDALPGSSLFRIGGVAGVTMTAIFPQGYLMLGALLGVFLLRCELDLLALGAETAQSLGLRVPLCRFVLLVLAALLAGSAVSFSGLLGFVGLLVPHISRRLVGTQSLVLLPCATVLGAAFLTGCDLLARLLFAPFELPVGLVLSLLGGPFFLWLLLRQKRRVRHD